MEKILEMIRQIENIEDFIKHEFPDGKINKDMARELLRMLLEIKETGLK